MLVAVYTLFKEAVKISCISSVLKRGSNLLFVNSLSVLRKRMLFQIHKKCSLMMTLYTLKVTVGVLKD